MFETFYQSSLQHPLLLLVACALGALVAARSRQGVHRSVRVYAAGLVGLAALDAWLTSTHIPLIGSLPGALATAVPVAFVILGDLRYLLLSEALTGEGTLRWTGRAIARGVAWSLVVPVLAQLLVRFVLVSEEPRVLFLTYELLFLALIAARHPYTQRNADGPLALGWQRALDFIAVAWYGTWVTADILILGLDLDVGYLVRVVANVLYYGALPAVLVWAAPRRA